MKNRRIRKWHKLAREREDARDAEEALLRECGWKHISDTPGCYWMWMKEWDGKTFLVDHKVAVRIQTHWDAEEDARLHPDEYED